MLKSGELQEPITLQSRSVAKDAAGQEVITWVDVANVWAKVIPLNAREFFAASAVQQEQTLRFRIRARTDVVPTWRLVWNGKNHDITGVLPSPSNEFIDVLAMQGIKDGR